MKSLTITIKNDRYKKIDPNKTLRSKLQERFLLKMFSIREMLKWKYNYFEANPKEHGEFQQIMRKRFHSRYKSMSFKKVWRLKMDELFYKESKRLLRVLKKREETKKQETRELIAEMKNPSRLLLNYDREIVSMMRRVRQEYCYYLKYPLVYPDIETEKKNFLLEGSDGKEHEEAFETAFIEFWDKRIALLCDHEIQEEKRIIRENWKQLLPFYYEDNNIYSEELQELLLVSDDDQLSSS